ncbi:hypothetical protein H8L32_22995 [Undibacterium sp. CY18W]|uniref:Uncharacterized protein n=1 Tax=Undibacterium hunanense TaxID=2762292 RepID=A0ABR6ZX41_9BURK|nr:hypothetical protein [Undibacterium hunanense]MBC3920349.1 hypothetical protein [Undibacterium hunanense]
MTRKVKPMPWEKVAGFIFGVAFVITLLVLNVFIPNPTPTQYDTFKIVLALAAAGVGGILAGFLYVEGGIDKFKLRAGGALAVFATVFLVTPAAPGTQKDLPVIQTNSGNNGTQIGVNQGTLNINRASASQPAASQATESQATTAQATKGQATDGSSAASQPAANK